MNHFFTYTIVAIVVAVLLFVVFLMIVKKIKNKKIKGVKGKDYYSQAVTRKESLGMQLRKLFVGQTLVESDLLKLEETLLRADIGPVLSRSIIDKLRSKGIDTVDMAISFIKSELSSYVRTSEYTIEENALNILLVLGVNGVGKTTSIGKLAHLYHNDGKKVLLAAGDTFRAAASEQLTRWAKVIGIPIIKQGEGADPASVVFDAIDSAKSKGVDLLIVDTAGRLQNKKHLMDELKKIHSIIERKGGAVTKNLLVLDSTTGQNAFHQAEVFNEVVGVDMIMMTKYDALSKGGIVFSISNTLKLPFSFIGRGEKISDIEKFDKELFIERIFS